MPIPLCFHEKPLVAFWKCAVIRGVCQQHGVSWSGGGGITQPGGDQTELQGVRCNVHGFPQGNRNSEFHFWVSVIWDACGAALGELRRLAPGLCNADGAAGLVWLVGVGRVSAPLAGEQQKNSNIKVSPGGKSLGSMQKCKKHTYIHI